MSKVITTFFLLAAPLLHAQSDYPPAYPREGASRMLENEHVIVWDINWLKQDYPVHRHRYDHTGVYYSPGDRIITSLDGETREVHTDAWNISFQLAEVTHTESGISDEPLQAVFIQIKRPLAGALRSNSAYPPFTGEHLLSRRSNDRVNVWEVAKGEDTSTETVKQHLYDAVVVWFDVENQPNVHFLARGTISSSLMPTAAERVFIFEIK